MHRADDNENSVGARLATYDELTKPLLDYYSQSGRLLSIDATGDVEEIFRKIDSKI